MNPSLWGPFFINYSHVGRIIERIFLKYQNNKLTVEELVQIFKLKRSHDFELRIMKNPKWCLMLIMLHRVVIIPNGPTFQRRSVIIRISRRMEKMKKGAKRKVYASIVTSRATSKGIAHHSIKERKIRQILSKIVLSQLLPRLIWSIMIKIGGSTWGYQI